MSEERVSYRFKGGDIRFWQYAKDPLPKWAVDVRPEAPEHQFPEVPAGVIAYLVEYSRGGSAIVRAGEPFPPTADSYRITPLVAQEGFNG